MNPFTPEHEESIGRLGESALIERLKMWLGSASPASPYGIGDDCAVLPAQSPHTQALVTADPVIYGRHFDDDLSPKQTAAKLLRRNISDIAAMGGKPTHAVIALALSPDVSIDWIEQFYISLSQESLRFDIAIVGGDVTSADSFLGAFLTLYGETLPSVAPLLRKSAAAGSPVFVTGELGGTRIQKHHAFEPRTPEGQWLARSGFCTSCTDLSDGLGKDFTNITASGLACEIDTRAIPISHDAESTARTSGKAPLYHALNDGEDFELLFTLRPDADLAKFRADWSERFQTKVTHIGTLIEGNNTLILKNGPDSINAAGYEHLR